MSNMKSPSLHSLSRGANSVRQQGFTLIELLVVIAIIAILAAILFPVFAQARERARTSMCMSNLKQIGIGIMQYTQDHDETYPIMYQMNSSGQPILVPGASYNPPDPVVPPTTTPTTPGEMFHSSGTADPGHGFVYTWMDYIFPYVKSLEVYKCPSRAFPWKNSAGNPKYWPQLGYNGIIGNYTAPNRPTRLADVNGASSKIFLLHHRLQAYVYVLPGQTRSEILAYPTYTGDNKARAGNLLTHQNGQVMMFADGHTKYTSGAKLSTYWTCNGVGIAAVTNDVTDGCGFWYPRSAPNA